MKNSHAVASIENVFDYFSWYGPSDLKSKECQFGTLGLFKTADKIQMAAKIRKNCWFYFLKQIALRKMIFYVQKKVKLKFWSNIAIRKLKMAAKFQNGRQSR